MRCLALADELRRVRGATVNFICCDLQGNIASTVRQKGYKVHILAQPCDDLISQRVDASQTKEVMGCKHDCDWLVVDHYSLDREWESQLRGYARQIMVIDDLANRPHDCDLLLDQNLYEGMEKRYENLVPSTCKQLCGPRYVLLRPEFQEWKERLPRVIGDVRRIMVFFSGSDPTNETLKALQAVSIFDRPDIVFEVVCGAANPYKPEIEQLSGQLPNVTCHRQVANMAELMARADLAIGAGGGAMWERCYLGLPAITMVTAENQLKTTEAVARKGAILYAGKAEDISCEDLAEIIAGTVNDVPRLEKVSAAALAVMAGHGLSWIEGFF